MWAEDRTAGGRHSRTLHSHRAVGLPSDSSSLDQVHPVGVLKLRTDGRGQGFAGCGRIVMAGGMEVFGNPGGAVERLMKGGRLSTARARPYHLSLYAEFS